MFRLRSPTATDQDACQAFVHFNQQRCASTTEALKKEWTEDDPDMPAGVGGLG